MSGLGIERRAVPASAPILDEPSLPPLLRRIYAARGIHNAAELEHRLTRLAAPDTLGGIDAACALLVSALAAQQSILIVGDFDADGATGTALALRGLRMLGAERVDFRVPHRFRHGYGLSPALVEELHAEPPELLITVDSGVACHAGVAAARALGCRVIVTDHHLPGASLPAADAMVNPNLLGDGFPSKALAGVGVMFYLLLALRAALRGRGWFGPARSEPDLSVLLDLVALGTVADMVPLDFNNRVLVAAGLKRIRAGRAQPGIRALLAVAGRDPAGIDASDLGFIVAPRLNAAGRLDDMALGIRCLLADADDSAQAAARRLDAINHERRHVQADMQASAEAWLQGQHPDPARLPPALVLFEPDWHAGVIGLVASRMKDQSLRPVIAFAPADEGSDQLKGSARSIRGLNIRDLLAELDARNPGLILRFGGHAMAAGLSLAAADFERFRERFTALVGERADPALFEPLLPSDGELQADERSLDMAEALRQAGPWGQGFAEPQFDGRFQIESARLMGSRHLGLRLRCLSSGQAIDAVHFGGYDGAALPSGQWHLLYQLMIDHWRDQPRLRLSIRHAIKLDPTASR
ncbi:MAG: single-stranded-DNA-specific exonuclease RecJ [Lysobacterales bacterium]